MLKKNALLCAVLVLALAVQAALAEGLCRVEQDGKYALADDSGICAVALGGAPGVFSARYAGGHGDDKKNRDLLLENLKNVSNRRANFTSAVAVVEPNGNEIVVEGKTYGNILYEEQGEGGFGYDCIFESDDLKKSFGLATAEEKNAVSHRFRALQALRKQWKGV